MVKKQTTCNVSSCEKQQCCRGGGSPSCAMYGIGLIGALVYFIQHAQSFMEGVAGIFKAVVWPALVVYKVLEFLKF